MKSQGTFLLQLSLEHEALWSEKAAGYIRSTHGFQWCYAHCELPLAICKLTCSHIVSSDAIRTALSYRYPCV